MTTGLDHDLEEHERLLDLVPYEAVTHTALLSGDWDDPTIWDHGLPGANANVLIPITVEVRIDSILADPLRTVRVDGLLEFATEVDTQLLVDTLVVAPLGVLEIGTAAQPVQADVEANIVFADRGPIDTVWDPGQLSRGLISHGSVTMYGAERTAFTALAVPPVAGATQLVLASIPVGWQVGDELVVTGVDPLGGIEQHEVVTIVDIVGSTVTINRRLAYDHVPPEAGLSVYIANTTRNIRLSSQNPDDLMRRGHVMFMHGSAVADINFAGFYDLGRTDKNVPLDPVEFNELGAAVAGTGTNQPGRYSIHFHHTCACYDHQPGIVRGSVVVGSPGWGYVNHHGYVIMEDNVAFDVFGAAFVSEAGDELGAMRRNIAIYSEGSGDSMNSRTPIQDFGHEGNGFWLHSPAIAMEGNVAAGQASFGIFLYAFGLIEDGVTVRFPSENLVDPSIAAGAETLQVNAVPLATWRDNTVFASGGGLQTWKLQLDAAHDTESVIENFVSWNTVDTGLVLFYTRNTTIEGGTILGNLEYPGGIGIAHNHNAENLTFNNLRVAGWSTGMVAPISGDNAIRGGSFENVRNIFVSNSNGASGSRLTIDDVVFGALSASALDGRTPYDIYMSSNYLLDDDEQLGLRTPMTVVLFNGQQVFAPDQASDFVPFPEGQSFRFVPDELIGLTNREMWDQYGLAFNGAPAPADAVAVPGIYGLVGDPVENLPVLKLASARYTRGLKGYRLSYTLPDGTTVTESSPTTLHEGWNTVVRQIDGHARTFLVYGDISPPRFVPDPSIRLTISQSNLRRGMTISGTIHDDSFAEPVAYTKVFGDLSKQPLLTRPDGSTYIVLRFSVSDTAGNSTEVSLEVTVLKRARK